jgi:hypothetical protein
MPHLDAIIEQKDDIGRQVIGGHRKHTRIAGVPLVICKDDA